MKGVDYIMRDLAENLAVLDAIRPLAMAAAEYNARANGTHATAAEIDLEDYGYPRKILVIVSIGEVAAGGTLDIDLESGDVTAVLTNTDASLDQMIAAGVQVYEWKPTRRFVNVECVVGVAEIDFGVTLVMEHCRFGNRGSDD